jgi:uncharacterized membrane protein
LEEQTASPYKVQFILFVILLMALCFRLFNLGGESLWLDEGISIRLAHLTPSQIVEDRASNIHPPLYFVSLHYWVNLFGDSEFSTRFLSVIFGTLAIPLIYRVGGLIFDKGVGVLSSLLLGLSVFHIQFSQEVRGYSLMVFLTLLSMYFFIELFRKRSLAVSVGYVLSSLLLIYTHVFGTFVIIAQNIYLVTLFLASKEVYLLSFKKWVLLQIALIILFTPWLGILINQILRIQDGFWVLPPSMQYITNSLKEYSSGSFYLLGLFLLLLPLSALTCEKIGGNVDWKSFFQSIENYSWKIRLSNVSKIYFLLVWLSTPIILPFVISKFSTPIYTTRVTIASSLAFYLLIAKGISNIDHRYVKLVVSIIVLLSLFNAWEYYTEAKKEQWRDVAKYIDVNAETGDLLLFNAGFMQVDVFDYYTQRSDLTKKPFPEKTGNIFYYQTTNGDDIKELWPTVEGHDRVWVILSHSRDRNELITKTLGEAYNLLYNQKYVGIKVYLFEKSR